jgi:hypothetical protein
MSGETKMQFNNPKVLRDPYTIAKNLGRIAEFKLGYEHAVKDISFNYQYQDEKRIAYFRGRAFAVYSKQMKFPRATWRDSIMSKAATERLVQAIRQRVVI